jgi:hypothetical protein
MNTVAYKIAGAIYCPTCVDIHGDLAQAEAEGVNALAVLYSEKLPQENGNVYYRTMSRACARCDAALVSLAPPDSYNTPEHWRESESRFT